MEAVRLLLVLTLLSGSLRPSRGLDEGLSSQEPLAEEPNGLGWVCIKENFRSGADHSGPSLLNGAYFLLDGPAGAPLRRDGKEASLSHRLHAGISQQQENEEHPAQISPEEHPLGTFLRSLLHAVQRPGRSPSFLFQPQRFGRDARSSASNGGRINPRAWDSMAPQFLSMAAPQRFGKKK
ncbi:hypothetical protein lerEdw1_004107 [Lerista edwardsae]|nr:hypothetical protein lerEdw1_004107 [Lerista edwardsae]